MEPIFHAILKGPPVVFVSKHWLNHIWANCRSSKSCPVKLQPEWIWWIQQPVIQKGWINCSSWMVEKKQKSRTKTHCRWYRHYIKTKRHIHQSYFVCWKRKEHLYWYNSFQIQDSEFYRCKNKTDDDENSAGIIYGNSSERSYCNHWRYSGIASGDFGRTRWSAFECSEMEIEKSITWKWNSCNLVFHHRETIQRNAMVYRHKTKWRCRTIRRSIHENWTVSWWHGWTARTYVWGKKNHRIAVGRKTLYSTIVLLVV